MIKSIRAQISKSPHGKTLDLKVNVFYPQKIVPKQNRFYSGLSQNTPKIKHFLALTYRGLFRLHLKAFASNLRFAKIKCFCDASNKDSNCYARVARSPPIQIGVLVGVDVLAFVYFGQLHREIQDSGDLVT